MYERQLFDLSQQWPGGVTIKGAKVETISRQEAVRQQQEHARQMGTTGEIHRTVHLDANYTQASTHNLTQYDVTVSSTILSRMSRAPQHVQDKVQESVEALAQHRENIDIFEKRKNRAIVSGDTDEAASFERRQVHAIMMESAIAEELRVAYIAGSKATAFDQRNKHGDRAKFRTDIEMKKELIEVTIGKRKHSKQLHDYLLAAQDSGKDSYLHAPNMTEAGQRFAEKYGFTVGRTPEDLFRFITRPQVG